MTDAWTNLEQRLRELNDYGSAIKLLEWDQAAMMPPEGGPARARAIATLEQATHTLFTDPELGDLIHEAGDSPNSDPASLRILNREYDKATRVPGELVRAIAEARGGAYQAWTQARPSSDFSILEPHLEKLLALKKEEADALGWKDERYDALLDQYEPGMTTKEVASMFEELMSGLKPLVEKVLSKVGDRPAFLHETFERDKQMEFCKWLVKELNFNFEEGRVDISPHPFTIQIGAGDVRQTTRPDADDLLMSVYAAVHETGHALYEQGIPVDILDLPIGRHASLGMHESQSRLWENQVGRSRAFTGFLLPQLKEMFPEQLGMITPEDFYRSVNHVERTLIRVTADELTYNLHVGLRFELETRLFRDELAVADLPGAWSDAMDDQLGLRPNGDGDGVLQDMHWSIGAFGYFPTYTLGTIYSAAFFDAAVKELGNLDEELGRGKTERLLEWLRANVHVHGYRYEAKDLAQKVVGGPITAEPLLGYLRDKYTGLYSDSV
ncbi:MAG: carboxypeptidase M32 [Actinobacteria bacterium]|nr:carboxypeptidase M32 [Actinomycetota bacterium]